MDRALRDPFRQIVPGGFFLGRKAPAMLCFHCQFDNTPGRRFCGGCGKALSETCGQCGFLNEPGIRFCGGCGAGLAGESQLARRDPATGDRRPVTVMFVDLSGYTEMSASLDPEDVHRLLHRFFERVDGIVVDHGGTIDKHIGDSVMALFGAPVSHGNDPERAIRAAVAIQAAMPELGVEFGRNLETHLGIALGEVVASDLGSAAHSTYTVTGGAANLAARLMDRAASGETLVAEALREVTVNIATYESLGTHQFKGLDKPQLVYRLQGLATDQATESALVGRQVEMGQLTAMLDTCLKSGRGSGVIIRGDPGIGKSRMIQELQVEARARGFQCLSGLVLDFGAGKGADATSAVTAGLLRIPPGTDPTTKSEMVDTLVREGSLSDEDRPFLCDLLDLPQFAESLPVYSAMSAAARRRGKAACLGRLLQGAALQQACLVVIEDMHWADEVILELLSGLASVVRSCPAMLVMSTRLEGDPFDSRWRSLSAGGVATIMDLHPLQPEEAAELAVHRIGKMNDLARDCIARAEGNPLFLEQLLRSRPADGNGKLPHSLQGIVLARLDSLDETDRQALQAASVLGQRFTLGDLSALINVAGYDCQPLIRRQLVRPPEEGFLIAHALIRDGVYASLTRERRRALHARAAEWFSGKDPVLCAEHLERSDDPGAPFAYLQASEAEAAGYRLDRANALVTKGLSLAVRDEERVRLALAAGKLRLDIGLAASARDAFQQAVDVASLAPDRCRAFIGLAAAERVLARPDVALDHLRAAESLALEGQHATFAEIYYLRGNLHFALGQGDDCASAHRLALEAARKADNPEWKARARSGLGDAAYLQGRIAAARRHFRASVDLAERHNLLRIIPANRGMIGDSSGYLLEPAVAFDEIALARETAVRIGDRFGEMFSYECAAFTLLVMRRWSELLEPTRKALDLAIELGARRYQSMLRMILARLHLALGESGDAVKEIDLALDLAEETGLGFCGPCIMAVKALVLGPTAAARNILDRGEEILATTGLAHNHIHYREYAIDWGIAARDWALVGRMLERLLAYTRAEPIPYVTMIADRARALMALASNPDDLQAVETLGRLRSEAQALDFRLDFSPAPWGDPA